MTTALYATSSATDTTVASVATSPMEGLNRDAFMHLLVTQMQYQDPMKPMDDTQFIAQLAQFSSLEQMQQVNHNLQLLAQMNAASQASSLIGKQITANSDGGAVSGRVDAVSLEDGQLTLVVGSTRINLGDVSRIEQ